MFRRLHAVLLFALMVLAHAPAVQAQSDEANKTTARELAKQGFTALEAGDYQQAAELFDKAEKLYHAPTLLLGLCKAHAGLEKYVEAYESCNKAAREKLGDDASPAFVRAVAEARELARELQPKIAWVVIKVTGHPEPEVTIDGVAMPAVSLGVPRAVNPGDHVVKAGARGTLDAEQQFTAVSGARSEVALDLQPDPTAAVEPEAAPAGPVGMGVPPGPTPDRADTGDTQRLWGWIALGVGGASLLVGGITGILAISAHGELEDNCADDGTCAPDQQDTIDRYHTVGTISTVGFIAGGVFAVTGTVLLLTAPSDEPTSPTVSAGVGPGHVQATVRF